MEALKAGTPAPEFSLPSTPDQRVALSEFRGRPVVLISTPPIGVPCAGTNSRYSTSFGMSSPNSTPP